MNEHENTDDLLKKMGEVYQRHSSNLDENTLLMRALEGRPQRSLLAVAGWCVAALFIVGFLVKPMLPAMGGAPYAEYSLGEVQVKAFHSDDEFLRGIYYQCTLEGKEFYIAQQTETHPEEPLVAEVRLGGSGCILYPADVSLAEPNLTEAKKLKPSLDLVKAVSSQMEKAKLWPADLWSIKPFVKKLARGEYRIVYSGPVNAGFVQAADMYIGDSTGCFFQGSGMGSIEGDDIGSLLIRLYIWPDSFTLKAYAKLNKYNIYLSGNDKGYDAYQTPEWWGEGVRNDLSRIKHYLPKYTELLPLLGDGISPLFAQSLGQTTEQIISGEPRALYRADEDELDHLMEPWNPARPDAAEFAHQMEALSGLAPKFSFKHRELAVSSREGRQEVVLTQGNTEIQITVLAKQWAAIYLTRNGKHLSTRLYVLNEGALPRLETEMSPEDEALLRDISSLANNALHAPSGSWPTGQFPTEYVSNWLKALSEREVAVWDSHGGAILNMTVIREGAASELLVSTGNHFKPELNLRIEPKGFEMLNTGTGYLVTVSDGKVSAIRTANAADSAVTDENVRQLKTALDTLSAAEEGIPSAIQPGITVFRAFLEAREVAEAKVVDKLPAIPWSGKYMQDRYVSIDLGIQSLKTGT